MMTATVCPEPEELRAVLLGQRDDPSSDEILEHLANCPTCRAQMETVEETADSLIVGLRSPDQQAATADEPQCGVALVKALGALSAAYESSDGSVTTTPRTIGEYEIIRPLGRGGMANVFLARHTKLGRYAALKILHGHRLHDAHARDRFAVEMRAIGRLSHPNIVTAHDAREVDGTAVLVTEYIDGSDLARILQAHGPLPLAEACEIARQVAVALEYIAQQGLVHRDVKPSNIMLSRQGEVKLLDLGLARWSQSEGQDLTSTGQAMGTADFIAPEQVNDSRQADIRADIYSLGCTLMKLLTGRAPFEDDEHRTTFSKMTAHVSQKPPRLIDLAPNIPAGLAQLIDNMLCKSPDQRPASPRMVAERLKSFCSGANLPAFADLAVQAERNGSQAPAARSQPSSATPAPFMRRRIPISTAIATAAGAFALGIAMGILIKIEYPDGTVVTHQLPKGAKVSIESTPDAPSTQKGSSTDPGFTPQTMKVPSTQPNDPLALPAIPNGADGGLSDFGPSQVRREVPLDAPIYGPFGFAILLEKNQLSEQEFNNAKSQLAETERSTPLSIPTPYGIWLPVAPGVSAPLNAKHEGIEYALVSGHSQDTIVWSLLYEKTLMGPVSFNGEETRFPLHFTEPVSLALHEFTARNMQRQLAIVIMNRIIAAPRIMTPISSQAEISFGPSNFDFIKSNDFAQLQRLLSRLPQASPMTGGMGQMPGTMGIPSWLPASTPQALPTLDSSGVATDNDRSVAQLRQIGIAFHNFLAVYRKLPASKNTREGTASTPGKPNQPCSWRVALLPFVEQAALYEQYHFHEPWDSEYNLKFLERMPEIYRSPHAPAEQSAGHTNYLGFVGPHSALGDSQGIQLADIVDGTSASLLLVESHKAVPWTKPEDLPYEKPEDAQAFEPLEGGAFRCLMLDGFVRKSVPLSWEELSKLISIKQAD